MIQYFKTKVAAAAGNAAMETVNHSKNRAMEADTISKHGRNPKSQMSRGNFKILAIIFLFVAAFFTFKSCHKEGTLKIVSFAVNSLVNEVPELPVAKEWAETVEIINTQSGSFQSDDPDAKPSTTKSTKASGIDCFAYNVEWKWGQP